jgi:hypothetical protein
MKVLLSEVWMSNRTYEGWQRAQELSPARICSPGTREKVRSKRINLEGNTHAQEINVSQCPV